MARSVVCFALAPLLVAAPHSPVLAQPRNGGLQSQQAEFAAWQIANAMRGGPNVWWVVNTQYSSRNGSVVTKERAHTVVQGTESAARLIVAYAQGKDPRGLRVNWESYKTQEQAEARAAWWRMYDLRAGYR